MDRSTARPARFVPFASPLGKRRRALTTKQAFLRPIARGLILRCYARGGTSNLALCNRRKYLFQFGNQRRQILADDFPENIEVYVVVAMDESVAQAHDLHPRNGRVLCALTYRDTARCFADDLQQPHQRKVERT